MMLIEVRVLFEDGRIAHRGTIPVRPYQEQLVTFPEALLSADGVKLRGYSLQINAESKEKTE